MSVRWEGSRRWMATPRKRYDWSIVRDALLMLAIVLILVAASTTGFSQ